MDFTPEPSNLKRISITRDEFDAKQIRRQEAFEQQLQEQERLRQMSFSIPIEKPVRPDKVKTKTWSTEYENPKVSHESAAKFRTKTIRVCKCFNVFLKLSKV